MKVMVALLGLVAATASAATGEVELRAELLDAAGQAVAKPTMRMRLGEETSVTIRRGATEVSLTTRVDATGPRRGCYTVHVRLEGEHPLDTSTVACDQQKVQLALMNVGPVISLQVVPVR